MKFLRLFVWVGVVFCMIFTFETKFSTVGVESNGYKKNSTNEQQSLYFVMHVGPPKTGTSTIQCALREMENVVLRQSNVTVMETESCRDTKFRKSLLKNLTITPGGASTYDNILGRSTFMPNCLATWSRDEIGMPQCWNESYGRYLNEQHEKGNSVVVSQENLINNMKDSNETSNLFSDLARSLPGFKVVVIVAYRHFFDWLPSLYNEQNKPKTKPRFHQWVSDGGKAIPTIEKYISSQINNVDLPFTDSVTDPLLLHPDIELKILDFNAGDVQKTFFCNAMPGNTGMRACDLIKNSPKTVQNQAKTNFWYDILANEAHKLGLVPEGIQRLQAAKKLQLFQRNPRTLGLSDRDFPMICPSQNFYDMLLAESLRREMVVKSNSFETEALKRHTDDFAKAVSEHEFCVINTTAVLEDQRWINYITNMTIEKEPPKKLNRPKRGKGFYSLREEYGSVGVGT